MKDETGTRSQVIKRLRANPRFTNRVGAAEAPEIGGMR